MTHCNFVLDDGRIDNELEIAFDLAILVRLNSYANWYGYSTCVSNSSLSHDAPRIYRTLNFGTSGSEFLKKPIGRKKRPMCCHLVFVELVLLELMRHTWPPATKSQMAALDTDFNTNTKAHDRVLIRFERLNDSKFNLVSLYYFVQ